MYYDKCIKVVGLLSYHMCYMHTLKGLDIDVYKAIYIQRDCCMIRFETVTLRDCLCVCGPETFVDRGPTSTTYDNNLSDQYDSQLQIHFSNN